MTSFPSASLIMTLSRPEMTIYRESVRSPAAMTVVPRGVLLRATMPATRCNCSSGKLANIGTFLSTAVDTGTTEADMVRRSLRWLMAAMLAEADY